jgi:hypothetical protein
MANEYSHRIVDPDVRVNGVEEKNCTSVSYNFGQNKELIDTIGTTRDRKLLQEAEADYSGELTIKVTQDGEHVKYMEWGNGTDEVRISIKLSRTQRLLFSGAVFNPTSSGDNGRELTASFIARSADIIG